MILRDIGLVSDPTDRPPTRGIQLPFPFLVGMRPPLDPCWAQSRVCTHSRPDPPLLQVTPIFGMYFLQAELTINECSRRRKWTERGAENIA